MKAEEFVEEFCCILYKHKTQKVRLHKSIEKRTNNNRRRKSAENIKSENKKKYTKTTENDRRKTCVNIYKKHLN